MAILRSMFACEQKTKMMKLFSCHADKVWEGVVVMKKNPRSLDCCWTSFNELTIKF